MIWRSRSIWWARGGISKPICLQRVSPIKLELLKFTLELVDNFISSFLYYCSTKGKVNILVSWHNAVTWHSNCGGV